MRTCFVPRPVALLLAWALLVVGLVVVAPGTPTAQATPQDPTRIFNEDFSGGTANPQMLTALPGGYTADTFWRQASKCNGIALSWQAPGGAYTDPNGSGTCAVANIDGLHNLALALGGGNAAGVEARSNFALSSYTAGSAANNLIQIETAPIPVNPGGWLVGRLRYAAFNCTAGGGGPAPYRGSPVYNFYLVNPATGVQTTIGSQVACASGSDVVATYNGLTQTAKVGTVTSPGSIQYQGTSVVLRVRNGNGNGVGNDTAIDDLQLFDASPSLQKTFVPATGAAVGVPFTMRFVVTNSTDLAAKPGITIADTMPAGLTIGPNKITRSTCGGTSTTPAGATSFAVTGAALAQGNETCDIDVEVISSASGSLVNRKSDITTNLQQRSGTDATVVVSNPSTSPDSATTPYASRVPISVLDNDRALDPTYPLDPTSVTFPASGQPSGAFVTNDGRTLTVLGEGVYYADPDTGVVTFDPDLGFSGAGSAVRYQVRDSNGAVKRGTIATTTGTAPEAGPDSDSTPYDTSVTTDVLANDGADPATALDPGSVVFPADGQPDGATVDDAGTTLTVPGEGVYTVDPATGEITFDPALGFEGAATPVTYRVADGDGNTATAVLSVEVGDAPQAVADSTTTPYDTAVSVDVLGNDTADDATALDPTSVVFPTAGQPSDAVVGDAGRRLTVPGEGVYTADPTTGAVTFDPEPGFDGTASPVTYAVSDDDGAVATGTVTVGVGAAPLAADDSARTPAGTAVTLPVLANDSADAATGLDPSSVVFPAAGQPAGAEVDDAGRTLTVPGEGVWTVVPATGAVRFTPRDGFAGDAAPVTYAVADGNGARTNATITVAVTAAPVASDDTASTTSGAPVEIAVLADDTTDPAVELDRTTLRFPLAGQPTGATVGDGGATLTVPGEGVYTVDRGTGSVRFAPSARFSGTAAAVRYAVDDEEGTTATGTLTVTVGPPPTVVDDTARTRAADALTVPVLANDSSDPVTALDPTSVVFPAADQPAGATVGAGGRSLTVPDEGVYTVDPATGAVTFAPADGFAGDASPVTYQVADGNGVTGTGQLSLAVTAAPTADDDTATTPYDTSTTVDVLAGDTADPVAPLDPTSVTFPLTGQPAGATVSGGGATLTVPAEGVYTVDPTTGAVTFDPETGFEGAATPVSYEVRDADGTTAAGRVTVTVGTAPQAGADAATTPSGRPVDVAVLANDRADAATALDPASVVFPSADQPAGATVGESGTTLTVPGQGIYAIDPASGLVTFTPEPAFEGVADPVTYTVADENGAAATGSLTVTVGAAPRAGADTATTPYGVERTVAVLSNDTADPDTTLDPTSVRFPTAGQPAGATASGDGRTLTVPDQGVYTADPTTGAVAFAPAEDFYGTASPALYAVADANGAIVVGALTVTVQPPPQAVDDSARTPADTDVSVNVLANDKTGRTNPLDRTSVVFTVEGQPAGATVDDGGRTLTVSDEGVYTIDPTSGVVSFDPARGFTGATAAVTYQVADVNGTTTTGRLAVAVGRAALAVADTARTRAGAAVTVPVLANDSADPSTALDPLSVIFTATDQPVDAVLSDGGRSLRVPGQGVFEIDPTDGSVRFTPADGFAGAAASVTYAVTDGNGSTSTATLSVTVTAAPVAADDSARTPADTTVTVSVLGNDAADPARPLDPGSVVFPVVEQPAGAVVGDAGRTLTVAGEGVHTVDPTTGSVSFDPDAGFDGTTSPVTYRVADADGTTTTAMITVSVGVGPAAIDDRVETPYGQPVGLDPLSNDTADEATALDPASLRFPTAGQPDGVIISGDARLVQLPDIGVFGIDPVSRLVTFVPVDDFVGSTPPVSYEVADGNGAVATATVVVDVGGPPTAGDDEQSTPFGTTTAIDVLVNDRSDPKTNLDPATMIFPADGQPAGVIISADRLMTTVPDQGVFTLDRSTGVISFDPTDDFSGAVTPVRYQVEDGFGASATAVMIISVGVPSTTADDAGARTPSGTPVFIDVLANDAADPSVRLDPRSVVFTASGQPDGAVVSDDGKTLTVPAEGVYTVDPDSGAVRFGPADGFAGDTGAVTYAVTDTAGSTGTGTLTLTVGAAPTAGADRGTVALGGEVTVPVLTNDDTDPETALRPSTLRFPDAGQPVGAIVAEDGSRLTVPAEAAYVINADATISLEAADGFTGPTTPVAYAVDDGDGVTAVGTLSVTVDDAPATVPEPVVAEPGTTVVLDPLGDPPPGTEYDPATLQLTQTGLPPDTVLDQGGKELGVQNEGTYTVTPAATITFVPLSEFRGETTPVTYAVADVDGVWSSGVMQVRLVPDPSPVPSRPPSESPGPSPSASPSSEPTVPPTGSGPDSPGALPATGAPVPPVVPVGGLLLLVMGAVVLRIRRRSALSR